jgi:hypothetical protein
VGTSLGAAGDLRVEQSITVATNADGALELFALGGNANVWHCWQPKAAQSWSRWEDLGGPHAGRPAATANADGRLEVFALGRDGGVGRRWQGGVPPRRVDAGLVGGDGLAGRPPGRADGTRARRVRAGQRLRPGC